MMRLFPLLLALGLTPVVSAGITTTSYTDATGDMFSGAPSNLDIAQVMVGNDANNVYITVETVGYADWTKYLFFFDTGIGGTGSNAWNRPIVLTREISHYMGSWVDQPTSNAQLWSWNGGGWDLGSTVSNDQSQTGFNRVTWTFSLSWLGLGVGDTFWFDVATSGGGDGDSGIDHLSRSDPATNWWSDPSFAGEFRSYTLVPAPGAIALLGLAGLAVRRRRD